MGVTENNSVTPIGYNLSMNNGKGNPMEIGKCETCEVETELVVTTLEQKFFGEALTHCEECSNEMALKSQERAFEAHWRG
jgi:predicted nucleic acid-binding Zn ribbon protein